MLILIYCYHFNKLLIKYVYKNFFCDKILLLVSQTVACSCSEMHEESPSSAEQGRQLTAGGGDSKESATEINRQEIGKDGKVE